MAPVQAPAQGEDDSAVPTYPFYNIKSGEWSVRVPTLAISIKQLLEFYQLVFLEFCSPVQMLGTTRSCLTQTGASCVLKFEICCWRRRTTCYDLFLTAEEDTVED